MQHSVRNLVGSNFIPTGSKPEPHNRFNDIMFGVKIREISRVLELRYNRISNRIEEGLC